MVMGRGAHAPREDEACARAKGWNSACTRELELAAVYVCAVRGLCSKRLFRSFVCVRR